MYIIFFKYYITCINYEEKHLFIVHIKWPDKKTVVFINLFYLAFEHDLLFILFHIKKSSCCDSESYVNKSITTIYSIYLYLFIKILQ